MLCVALAGCKGSEPARIEDGAIKVSTDRVVQTGSLGGGSDQATYVLVDADNVADHDLQVILGGTLQDAAGKDLGALRRESLRIPAHGRRTFALVDGANQARPTATTAEVHVEEAAPPAVRASARLEDVHLFDDHGHVMIAANLINDSEHGGTLIVFAGFHDADGKPMQRQFSVQEIGSHITQVVRFTGPYGSKTGYLFLGDAIY